MLNKAVRKPWLGSEIQEADIDLRDYVVDLLEPPPTPQSYVESNQPDEGFTEEQTQVCKGL